MSILPSIQFWPSLELFVASRTIYVNKRNEIAANEIWQFPLLIHLSAKAIQSRIREQSK